MSRPRLIKYAEILGSCLPKEFGAPKAAITEFAYERQNLLAEGFDRNDIPVHGR